MKVPIQYKSSDRYNAGTDVIYDDGSKLQYAPFIYAGVTAKDNGDGGGDDDDEEGEDTMVLIYDSATHGFNKSFKDLKEAFNTGKIIIMDIVSLDDETGYQVSRFYLVGLNNENVGEYIATFASVYDDDGAATAAIWTFTASTETDIMSDELENG